MERILRVVGSRWKKYHQNESPLLEQTPQIFWVSFGNFCGPRKLEAAVIVRSVLAPDLRGVRSPTRDRGSAAWAAAGCSRDWSSHSRAVSPRGSGFRFSWCYKSRDNYCCLEYSSLPSAVTGRCGGQEKKQWLQRTTFFIRCPVKRHVKNVTIIACD